MHLSSLNTDVIGIGPLNNWENIFHHNEENVNNCCKYFLTLTYCIHTELFELYILSFNNYYKDKIEIIKPVCLHNIIVLVGFMQTDSTLIITDSISTVFL